MKKPVFLYACLAILFAGTAVFQIARARTERMMRPFVVQPTPQGFIVGWMQPSVLKTGLRYGDILKSIDGKALTGLTVLGDSVARARPGSVLRLVVQSRRAGKLLPERTVLLPVPATEGSELFAIFFALFFYALIPIVCIALGFWVAAVRLHDLRAWLFLGLMLASAGIADPALEFWKPPLSEFGAVYYAVLQSSWPILMLFFGIYFPEEFPQLARRPERKWLLWVIVIPFALWTVLNVITTLGALGNYLAVRPLLEIQTRLAPVDAALIAAGVAGFLACIALKFRFATSRDARRRLKLILAGCLVSGVPMGSLISIMWVKGWSVGSHFPGWLWFCSFITLFLFPATLAYVIVVERAMDVRVVVRQGLRYAFAKSGLNVIQVGFGIASIAAAIFLLRHTKPYSPVFFLVIAVAAAVFIKTRQAFRKLRLWIDRRFFRDAFNAEQILSELGDKVRSIIEPRPLLDKVCRSIADSLHVPRVAALMEENGTFRPAWNLGYHSMPEVGFAGNGVTVGHLRSAGEPLSVYLDDRSSWVYRKATSGEERAALKVLGSRLLLPLAANDRLMGFLSLSEKRSEEPYSGSDVRLLKSVASQAGLALENAQLSAALAREAAERERLNREVEIAREVQERLFPQKLPPVPGLNYSGVCRPASGVAGDYYDFFPLPNGQFAFAIADVSGKGISAALTMASLQAWLRGEAARADSDLSRLGRSLNHLIFEASASNRYATLFYAQLDPCSHRLSYLNAGHNPPVLLKRRGESYVVERLGEGGTVIGLFEETDYPQGGQILEEGSLLVAFTDGVTEAMNREGEEWGEERLIETVRGADQLPAAEIIHRIFGAVDSFRDGAEQRDDITLLVLRAATQTPELETADLPPKPFAMSD
jgi:sigma-B regulation protein RsbU (phosphoserine phosphatase)